uniref:Sushi domain-containing protein n=1 Tax=Ciona savignyi TaxID=51511 RepID=H2Z7B4_CIOSA
IGSVITYRCSRGYEIIGQATLTCADGGNWSHDFPTCAGITCRKQRVPRHGTALPSDIEFFSVGGEVTYRCNDGYELDGPDEVTCGPSGVWSRDPPTCVVIVCLDPVVSEFGSSSPDPTQWLLNSVITFRCNGGYTLVGAVEATCTRLGSWSNDPPACEEILCPSLSTTIENGIRSPSDDTNWIVGTRVTYSCNPGYQLSGHRQIRCTGSGVWSGEEPTCVVESCSPPVGSELLTFEPQNLPNYPVNTVVTFSCVSGYTVEGSNPLTCAEGGVWSADEPSCVVIICPTPSNPTNGDVTSEVVAPYLLGATVEYSCDSGFSLHGSASATCMETGLWSSPEPTCRAIVCSRPGRVENGGYTLTTATSILVGTRAVYHCNSGYEAVGDRIITCLNTGEWSSSSPICREILCPSLSQPTQGSVVVTSRSVQGVATYSCNTGYRLDGPQVITCFSNGRWSNTPPTCVGITCLQLPSLDNGSFFPELQRPYDVNSVVRYRCDNGYQLSGGPVIRCNSDGLWSEQPPTCTEIKCRDPLEINHGIFNPLPSYYIGSRVSYRCNPGYQLQGDETIICENNGEWSSTEPTCNEITCPALTAPTNGLISNPRPVYTYGNTVFFTCHLGYRRNGQRSIHCSNDGTWSHPVPTCEEITCPALTPILNGQFTPRTGPYQLRAVVTHTCNDGYRMQGAADITCQESGRWAPSQPRCVVIECPLPSAPQNGVISPATRTKWLVDQSVRYSCEAGYDLVGTEFATCMRDRRWSSPLPLHVKVHCASDKHFILCIQINLNCSSSIVVGVSVVYQCNTGYRMVGSASATCLNTGLWSEVPPACTANECLIPTTPVNGFISSQRRPRYIATNTITYGCDDGYSMDGGATITCQPNSSWSNDPPVCEEITCDELPSLDNGSFFPELQRPYDVNSVVRYRCDNGYQLSGGPVIRGYEIDGQANLVCLSTGTWSHPEPECIGKLITCPTPSSQFAQIVSPQDTYVVGDVVQYMCDVGFTLMGSERITCTESGQYSDFPPTCTEITCRVLLPIAHGSFAPRRTSPYPVTSSVTYSCVDGFQLDGEAELICQPDGTWSADRPQCQVIQCTDPVQIDNGRIVFTFAGTIGFIRGSVVRYRCNHGFEMEGANELTCSETGQWSSEFPTCNEIRCGDPIVPRHASILSPQSTYEFGDQVEYQCDDGYNLQGSNTITCLSTGRYSDFPPVCTAVRCLQPNIPTNGRLTDRIIFTHYEVGSSVAFECRPGYEIVGVRSITCEDSGQWSDTEPTCRVITCEDRTAPSQGTISTTSTKPFTLGNTVSYTCNNGYQLSGSNTAECQQNGRWSAPPPACREIKCRDIRRPQSGSYESSASSNIVGAVVTFECISGYSLVGESSITCLDTALWSNSEPTCRGSSCSTPPNTDADIRAGEKTQYIVGDVITYACGVGLEMIGSNRITCQASGQWTSLPPTCSEIRCSRPTWPLHGSFSPTVASYPVGDTVTFQCETGYGLDRDATIECMNTGEWSGPFPRCTGSVCSPPNSVTGATYLPIKTEYNAGNQVTYTCGRGYRTHGSSVLTCQNNGLWSSAEPTCTGVTCPVPPSIANGRFAPRTLRVYGAGVEIRYFCNSGYTLRGPALLTCLNTENWSSDPPTCEGPACGLPPTVLQATYSPSNRQRYAKDSVVTYSCKSGYRITGDGTVTCQQDGSWIPAQLPTCQEVSCNPPVNPNQGFYTPRSAPRWYVGITIQFQCNQGYRIVGESTATCQNNGHWSLQNPTCTGISCNRPGLPHRGSLDDGGKTTWVVGDIVTYSCDGGYALLGQRRARCMDTGQWSSQPPTCRVITCPVPTPPTRGSVAPSNQFRYRFGEVITYSCIPGYQVVGNAQASCMDNGEWSHPVPRCDVPVCRPITRPTHGSFSSTDLVWRVGTEVTFQCSNGYSLVGSATITCQTGAVWTDRIPAC